jgi:hypothetical protein
MSALSTHATARVAARAAAVVLIGMGVVVAAGAQSDALGLPDPGTPLVSVTTPVTDTLDEVTRPLTGSPAPTTAPARSSSARGKTAPAPSGPAPSGGQAADQSQPSARASAGGDNLVAADADVDGLLGLCVRVPSDGTHPKADLVVLDRDVLAALAMAGVPVREAIEPCPAGMGSPHGAAPGATGASSSTQPARAAGPAGDPFTGRLAFTGAEVVPTAVLAVGLLWLGVLMTLASRRLASVAVPVPVRQGA